MNLTELQTELRRMENQIHGLYAEMETMKLLLEGSQQRGGGFKEIDKLAGNYPIKRFGMVAAPCPIKYRLIVMLSYVCLSDAKNTYNGLLYLCRLAAGAGFRPDAEKFYKSGLQMKEDIQMLCDDLQPYKHIFLVESLIILNIQGKEDFHRISLIADLAMLMGCDKEEMNVIALIAGSVITDDINIIKSMPLPSENRWSGTFRAYIPRDWVVTRRMKCITICTERHILRNMSLRHMSAFDRALYQPPYFSTKNPCVVVDRQPDGTIVKKGQAVLIYKENSEAEEKYVCAACDGIVCFIDEEKASDVHGKKDKYLSVYIISFFDDYDDFIAWHENKA
ncbi:MAG: hypothetical protein LUE14_05660 [Clostridiales bacterium]|nr:hypothetical protein [Clostridiales bacterium]